MSRYKKYFTNKFWGKIIHPGGKNFQTYTAFNTQSIILLLVLS